MSGAGQSLPNSVSNTPPDVAAPSIPTGLGAGDVTQTRVTLVWNASTDNVGVAGYRLYEDVQVNYFYSYWVLRVDSIATLSVAVTGLAPGSIHRYAVTAFDGAGNESARSITLKVRTLQPPLAYHPTKKNELLYAVVGELFTYQVAAIGVTAPTFSLVTGPMGMSVGSISGMVQWTPAAGDQGLFTATVRATNSEGSDDYTFSLPVYPAQTDLEPPGSVRRLVVTNISQRGATLIWEPVTDNVGVVGYYLLAQQGGRGQNLFTAGKSIGTRYTITTLKPNTRYRIWVVAYDAAGNTATISGVPPAQITTLALKPTGQRTPGRLN